MQHAIPPLEQPVPVTGLAHTCAVAPGGDTAHRPAGTADGDAASAATGLLAELTAGLAAGDDLRELLIRFLEPIMQIAGAAAGALRVLDGRDQRMHLVGEIGLPHPVLEAERSVESGCGACGAALASAQLHWVDDLAHCAQRSDAPFFGSRRGLLAVPLAHRGRMLGLLNLFFDGDSVPSPQVRALLKTIGELLGLALDNARLERETLRNAVTGERQALAAELHDSLGQSLACVKLRLPLLQDAIDAGDRDLAQRYFDDVRSGVGEAHATLRGILTQFRAPADPLGLAHALQAGVESFRRQAVTVLEYDNRLPSLRLAPDDEAQVFLIVREALSNIARHAHAQRAWLTIAEIGNGVRVSIEDDGVGVPGVPRDGTDNHFGLQIMHERARRLRATLAVDARPGGGTRVRLDLPRALTPAVARDALSHVVWRTAPEAP